MVELREPANSWSDNLQFNSSDCQVAFETEGITGTMLKQVCEMGDVRPGTFGKCAIIRSDINMKASMIEILGEACFALGEFKWIS
jgi:hypothetical protein